MTAEDLLTSAKNDSHPPEGLSDELRAMWFTKSGDWESAHDIAQDIPSSMGSWIHALLHLIEGDIGNAGYWFRNAGRPVRSESEIDALWEEITTALLSN